MLVEELPCLYKHSSSFGFYPAVHNLQQHLTLSRDQALPLSSFSTCIAWAALWWGKESPNRAGRLSLAWSTGYWKCTYPLSFLWVRKTYWQQYLILQSFLLSHSQLPLLRSPLQEEFASAQTQTCSSCCPVEAIWQAANNTARWSFGQMVFLRFRGCLFLNY